jgi:glutaredoxin
MANNARNARNPAAVRHGSIRVTLLTKPQCAFCEDAKAVLSRLADEYHIVIETVEVNSPAGELLAMRGGVLFPPGVFLDGKPFSYGRLSERRLRRELERRRLTPTG